MQLTVWVRGVSGVGAGGAGCASAPLQVLICQNFEKNLKTFGQRISIFFNNIDRFLSLAA